MYDHVVYALNPGNVVVTLTNLPSGSYEVLVYSDDGAFELLAGTNSYGLRTCHDSGMPQPPMWTEGVHYTRFTNVAIGAGQPLVISVQTGQEGFTTISGLQVFGPRPIQRP